MMATRSLQQQGWSVLDVLLALLLSTVLISVFMAWMRESNRRLIAQDLATGIKLELRMLVRYAQVLQLRHELPPAGRFTHIPWSVLRESGISPPYLARKNALGQRYIDYLGRPHNRSLLAVVFTLGRPDGFRTRRLDALATWLGGFTVGEITDRAAGACLARGSLGGWCLPAARGLRDPGPGHLVALKIVNLARRLDLALDRYPVGNGRQWNTMHTTLGLGGHRVVGARSYALMNGSTLGSRDGGDLRLGRRHTDSHPYIRWAYGDGLRSSSLRLSASAPDALTLAARSHPVRLNVHGEINADGDVTADSGRFALSQEIDQLDVYHLCPQRLPNCHHAPAEVYVPAPVCFLHEHPEVFALPEAVVTQPAQPLEGESAFATPHGDGWDIGLAVLLDDGASAHWQMASGDVLVATRCTRSSTTMEIRNP